MSEIAREVRAPASGAVPRCAVAADAVAVLLLVPLAAAVVVSFVGEGGEGAYGRWWGTARGWESLGRTAGLAALAATFGTVLAWLVAWGAGRMPAPWAAAVPWLACLPVLVPSSLLATAWIAALGREGVLSRALGLGGGGVVYTVWGAAGALALRYFGLGAVVLAPAYRRLAAGWAAERVFRLPPAARTVHLRLRPALGPTAAAWLIVLLFAMNDHIMPGMFLISTYGTQVLVQYQALLDPRGAAALAVPMAGAAVGIGAAVLALGRQTWRRAEEGAGGPPPAASRAGRAAGVAAVAAGLGLALAVPVAVLGRRAGSGAAVAEALASAREQVWQTLLVASAAGGLGVALASMLAVGWLAARRRGSWSLAPLVLVNLAVPPSLPAIGLIHLAQRGPAALADTSWPLVAAYLVRFVPAGALLLYALWRGEPAEPVAAARVHGLSWGRTAVRVLGPRHGRTLAGVALVVALLVATELEMSILLAPAGGSTLGVRLYTLLHTAPEAMTAALALGLLVLAAPAILAAGMLLARRHGVAAAEGG